MEDRTEGSAPAGPVSAAGADASRRGVEGAVSAAVLLAGAYVAAQLMSDIGSLKIALFAGLSMDAGTLVYPVTFTLRDLIHKRLGKAAARTAVLLAAGINVVMALYFQLVVGLSPDPTWPLDEAFGSILGPVWRIVLASIVAEVVAELVDGETYAVWESRYPKAPQWTRVLVSNLVSVPLDSLVFCWGAFAFDLPAATIWSIFAANVLVKGVVTLLSLPGIYLVRKGD